VQGKTLSKFLFHGNMAQGLHQRQISLPTELKTCLSRFYLLLLRRICCETRFKRQLSKHAVNNSFHVERPNFWWTDLAFWASTFNMPIYGSYRPYAKGFHVVFVELHHHHIHGIHYGERNFGKWDWACLTKQDDVYCKKIQNDCIFFLWVFFFIK